MPSWRAGERIHRPESVNGCAGRIRDGMKFTGLTGKDLKPVKNREKAGGNCGTGLFFYHFDDIGGGCVSRYFPESGVGDL